MSLSRQLDQELAIHGKLDRIERSVDSDRSAVIDYKTGRVRTSSEAVAGEDVQLTTYALLADEPAEVAYLKLDAGKARTAGELE